MNLRENIINHIDNHDYDDFTKIRWIYLYVCSIFSYDTRFIFGKKELKKEIYNKRFNLNTIEEFEIVCYTIAKIIVDALEIYNIKSQIVRETKRELTHVYVLVHHNGKVIKLDPMIQHDTSRVKIGLDTINFVSEDSDPSFNDRLKEANEIINFPMSNIDFDNLKNAFENDSKLSNEEKFMKKLNLMFDLINKQDFLKRYDDLDYFMGYLIIKLGLNAPFVSVKPAIFYKFKENGEWDYLNIILVEYPGLPVMFYKMEKEGEKFLIKELDKKETLDYLEEYDGLCGYYFKNKINKFLK